MKTNLELKSFLAEAGGNAERQITLFAFVNLGIIESLANGLIGASDAVRFFFNAENCLFVRKHFKDKTPDKIMGHGVQLPDLFDALPAEEAGREFLHELAIMKDLCLKLIEREKLVAYSS